jgi:hypothetical protein
MEDNSAGNYTEPVDHLPPPPPSIGVWQPRDITPGMESFNALLDILQANNGIELYPALAPMCVCANSSKNQTVIQALERLIRAAMPLYDVNDRSPEHAAQTQFVHGLLLLLWGSKEAVQASNKARRLRCKKPPTAAEKLAYLASLQPAVSKISFMLTLGLAALRNPAKQVEIANTLKDARVEVASWAS